jgi:Fic family protein
MKNTDRHSVFGHFVRTIQDQQAFVPAKLPPQFEWSSELVGVLSDANLAIGQLHGAGLNLPNPDLLITPFIRREAESSSKIEGTQAQVRDIYLFEMNETSVKEHISDVREVSNYVRALEYGLKRCKELPVCLRLIKELHNILLEDVRGEGDRPGNFRNTQNWIGTKGSPIEQASYIPPPPENINECLDAFEKFLNISKVNIPMLVWLAMIHYQFEAIHPFRDGNGRIGRLLMILLLCTKNILDKPMLYLSAYFERNRLEYYNRLLRVSTHGEWTHWIHFFLQGIIEQSNDAFIRSRALLQLQQKYHRMIKSKRSALQIKIADMLIERPVITTVHLSRRFNITYQTAKNNIIKLMKAGILKEVPAMKRHRLFIADEVLDIINRPFSISKF